MTEGPRRLYAADPDCVEMVQLLLRELRAEPVTGVAVVTVHPDGAHRVRWAGSWGTIAMLGALELAKFEIATAAIEQAETDPPPATA